jgi:hypothetical protein
MIGDDTQIICTGTAWVTGVDAAQKVYEIPVSGTDLQFSRRGLDSSFLITLNLILLGLTYTDVANASRSDEPMELGVQRVAGSIPAPGQAVHIFELSAPFCERLAQSGPARAREIARDWYALQGHHGTRVRPGRVEYRAEIIQNLAAMAQVALAREARLLLRVAYEASP